MVYKYDLSLSLSFYLYFYLSTEISKPENYPNVTFSTEYERCLLYKCNVK